LLAQIPITTALREGGDEGKPIAAVAPESETGKAFAALAEQIDKMKPKKIFSKGLKLL
jgi:ATP-binding protein involved in chromosome partitioning